MMKALIKTAIELLKNMGIAPLPKPRAAWLLVPAKPVSFTGKKQVN